MRRCGTPLPWTSTHAANIDGAQPWRKGVADDVLTCINWQRGIYFKAVTRALVGVRRVGLELDHLPVDRLNALEQDLPGVEFVDLSAAGLELREDIDTVIEPNMVVSMELMIMLPKGLPGAGG